MSLTRYELDGRVATLSMSDPPAELLTRELIRELAEAVQRARRDEVRAMIIRSDGRLFSGGADVNLFYKTSRPDAREMLAEGLAMINAIEDAPFPVIAAVRGACLAAGLEIALACDLIIASDDAVFAQVEALIGATTFLGGAYRLAERCGPARAREIVYTAQMYPAKQFEQWNIINRIVPGAELDDAALKLATQIAKGPALAHDVTKQLIKHSAAHGVRATDQYSLDAANHLFPSEDMQNALAFMLTEGPKRFLANHGSLVFEGR